MGAIYKDNELMDAVRLPVPWNSGAEKGGRRQVGFHGRGLQADS